jgi:pimeloyl-ACP methyl ester carboxylesterase
LSRAAGDGVVFVHGAMHGAWCWERVLARLQRGEVGRATELPGRAGNPAALTELTATDFADAVIAEIDVAGWSSVVLVGHSMAGVVLPIVARRIPDRIQHLVYVSALVPPVGASPVDLLPWPLKPYVGYQVRSALSHADRGLSVPRWLARRMFCSDLSPLAAREVLERLCPEAPRLFIDPVADPPTQPGIGVTYVRLGRDKALPPRIQDRVIAGMGDVTIADIAAGHDAMLSEPHAVAAIIDSLVGSAD